MLGNRVSARPVACAADRNRGVAARDRQGGFTLIELMVVVLIIAILVAIALPAFLGMRDRGHEAAAKATLRNGVTDAQSYQAIHENFTGMDATQLGSLDGGIAFADGMPAAGNAADTVYVGGVAAGGYTLSVKSVNGAFFRCLVVNYGPPSYTKSVDGGTTWVAW